MVQGHKGVRNSRVPLKYKSIAALTSIFGKQELVTGFVTPYISRGLFPVEEVTRSRSKGHARAGKLQPQEVHLFAPGTWVNL